MAQPGFLFSIVTFSYRLSQEPQRLDILSYIIIGLVPRVECRPWLEQGRTQVGLRTRAGVSLLIAKPQPKRLQEEVVHSVACAERQGGLHNVRTPPSARVGCSLVCDVRPSATR